MCCKIHILLRFNRPTGVEEFLFVPIVQDSVAHPDHLRVYDRKLIFPYYIRYSRKLRSILPFPAVCKNLRRPFRLPERIHFAIGI